ncbi:MAG: hypothetical protein KU37_06165 [Sulfuricurvum sp. PC08-66]|nr:MAG: hypothetical protein KU37_06165 [Sulfuricurvum sp. PC08-66]
MAMVKKSLLFTTVVLALSGCGDIYQPTVETNTTTPPTTTTTTDPNAILSGVFVDSPVEGLYYKTSSGITGTTDSQGVFHYKSGDTIQFRLSSNVNDTNTYLGNSVTAQSLISPFYVFGSPNDTNINDINRWQLNLARLLQSLDSDNNTSNGVTIDANVTVTANSKTIDFGLGLSDFGVSGRGGDEVSILTTYGKTIVGVETAKIDLNNSLNLTYDAAADINGQTMYGLWNFGSQYTKYVFGTGVGTTVTYLEQSADAASETAKSGTWTINSDGELVITREGSQTETISKLAVISTNTFLGANSYSDKHFGSLQKGTQTLSATDVNATTLHILRPTGEYAIYDLNTSGQGTATLQEDRNNTIAWSVASNRLELDTTRTNGIDVNSSLQFITNRDKAYIAFETLEVNNSTLYTDRVVAVSKDSLKFYASMVAGKTFYTLAEDGFLTKMVFGTSSTGTSGTGTISYQKDTDAGISANSYSFTWTVNASANTLTINNTKYYNGTTDITIVESLKAISDGMMLVSSAHDVRGTDYKLYFEKPDTITAAQLAGTYAMYRREYNTTTAGDNPSINVSRTNDEYSTKFETTTSPYAGGIYNSSSSTPTTPFTWSINSDGQILKYEGSTLMSTSTILRNYRGTMLIHESFVSTTTTYQRYYTYIKQ